MSNNITKETIDHIKASEGLRLESYPDPGSKDGNPWTIGYGTTRINGKAVPKGLKISKDQAEQYLIADLKEFAKKIDNVIDVPLNDNQYGALLSFSYNVGFHAFTGSTLLRLLNQKRYGDVPAQMMRWNKNDGKVMKGLVNRREKEVALWSGTSIAATEKPTESPKPSIPNKGSSNIFTVLLELLIKLFTGRK